ncbi:MAG: hypothetical protein GY832_28555 [Chloroflexi bacterium]|nr:hypothetical protein [Chloroflexota bacterium]
MDAVATPFVQGQLWGEHLSFVVETECANSGQLIQIEIDSELKYRIAKGEADLRIFVPLIDVDKLDDPSIIDAF